MAGQLAGRFGIPGVYSDVDRMLGEAKPTVVHVTTPPQSHLSLALQCIEARSHVYLEKPFAVNAEETAAILKAAEAAGRFVTAGHNYQFTPEMIRARGIVRTGYLGGPPRHIESVWFYDLGDASYVAPMLGSGDHWVRRLPGKLLHNNISHGVARLAEYLHDDITHVEVDGHQSAQLRPFGAPDVVDELRVLLRDSKDTTAYFNFTTQIKPGLNQFRICGPSNSLTVDLVSGAVLKNIGRGGKSYLAYLIPPCALVAQAAKALLGNAFEIATGRLHQDSGMKALIEQFYVCIRGECPVPIPYREILLTARIMDAIFRRLSGNRAIDP
jgi:predicted dehydrogenase